LLGFGCFFFLPEIEKHAAKVLEKFEKFGRISTLASTPNYHSMILPLACFCQDMTGIILKNTHGIPAVGWH
jgi:hypothetical protein